jgi:hypothetical protein
MFIAIAAMPLFVQFAAKMSAKDVARMARKPKSRSAHREFGTPQGR